MNNRFALDDKVKITADIDKNNFVRVFSSYPSNSPAQYINLTFPKDIELVQDISIFDWHTDYFGNYWYSCRCTVQGVDGFMWFWETQLEPKEIDVNKVWEE